MSGSCRRAWNQTDLSMAPRWMWHKGAFWLTASVQADLRCLDLTDLEYTQALWAAALTPHTVSHAGSQWEYYHYRDPAGRPLIGLFGKSCCRQ